MLMSENICCLKYKVGNMVYIFDVIDDNY